jgi:predicted MFS family arabinose efflux permease
MTTSVLFFVFPPVWAAAMDIPVEDLVPYYPIVGLVLVVARFTVGRRLDGMPRGLPVLAGVGCGAVALLVAAAADTVTVLTVAGCLFAIGSSATSSMHMSIVMDRADPARRGASMATYSLGFQLGYGLGSALWGLLIERLGFPSPFLGGLAAMALMMVLVLGSRRELLARRPPVAA